MTSLNAVPAREDRAVRQDAAARRYERAKRIDGLRPDRSHIRAGRLKARPPEALVAEERLRWWRDRETRTRLELLRRFTGRSQRWNWVW